MCVLSIFKTDTVKANTEEYFCCKSARLAKAWFYFDYSPLLVLFEQGNNECK